MYFATLPYSLFSCNASRNLFIPNALGYLSQRGPRFGARLAPSRAMRVAIPTWSGRISPVFDVAERLLLVEVENGVEVGRREERIGEAGLARRAMRVADLGVDAARSPRLVCGKRVRISP